MLEIEVQSGSGTHRTMPRMPNATPSLPTPTSRMSPKQSSRDLGTINSPNNKRATTERQREADDALIGQFQSTYNTIVAAVTTLYYPLLPLSGILRISVIPFQKESHIRYCILSNCGIPISHSSIQARQPKSKHGHGSEKR